MESRRFIERDAMAVVSGVALAAAMVLLAQVDMAPALRAVVVAVATIPFGLMLYGYGRRIASRDEMHVRAQLEALAFALGGTSLVAAVVGLLQFAGLSNLNWIWVYVLAAGLYWIGLRIAYRRYR